MWTLVVVAVVIVAALAVYAVYLQRQIKLRDLQRAQWREEIEGMVEERTDRITKSIVVIASATLEEQMSLSESCIRLSALLNQLGEQGAADQYQTIHKAAEELNHIPILEEWKQLKFSKRMGYLKEMERIEEKYGEFVLASCRQIQQQGLGGEQPTVGYYQP